MSEANHPAGHGHDKAFVATFLAVLAVLVGITVAIAVVANSIDAIDEGLAPIQVQQTQERLQPVGSVYTDASQVAVAPEPATEKSEVDRSPQQIVDSTCGACHASGVAGAIKFDDTAAWQSRRDAAGGMDGLVQSVLNGKGAMPPKGGDASLSEEQVRAAVEDMLNRAGL